MAAYRGRPAPADRPLLELAPVLLQLRELALQGGEADEALRGDWLCSPGVRGRSGRTFLHFGRR